MPDIRPTGFPIAQHRFEKLNVKAEVSIKKKVKFDNIESDSDDNNETIDFANLETQIHQVYKKIILVF